MFKKKLHRQVDEAVQVGQIESHGCLLEDVEGRCQPQHCWNNKVATEKINWLALTELYISVFTVGN